jgi:molybdopterin/thiamine biosynthesis adenylyltransferase
MLSATFVRDCVLKCRDERLAYLAVHNHGGGNSVEFSSIDLESHERGYPALLDVIRGQPVGAFVFSTGAVAGDIWLSATNRAPLARLDVIGSSIHTFQPRPAVARSDRLRLYDRQSRLFGDAGQAILRRLKVGVVGVGGVGVLIVEYLARLGVGEIVVVDPDVVEESNLPRLIGADASDAKSPRGLRKLITAQRGPLPKVELARRIALRANRDGRFVGINDQFQNASVAGAFVDCDYLFLAADSMQARLLFNAMVHQYFVPGFQVGSKAVIEPGSGRVLDAYSIVRPVFPGAGCLWCNGAITPSGLQAESAVDQERGAQAYVDDPGVPVPSVITMNATGAAQAANDFLFSAVGLMDLPLPLDYVSVRPLRRDVRYEAPRKDDDCPECSLHGRFGRGDTVRLPTRQ